MNLTEDQKKRIFDDFKFRDDFQYFSNQKYCVGGFPFEALGFKRMRHFMWKSVSC